MVKTSRLPTRMPSLLQLHIELKWITPKVWRRFVVPENITLVKLHQVIQIVMDWGGSEYEFEIASRFYGELKELGRTVSPQARKTLARALEGEWTFNYLYDFSDGWDHHIIVEERLPATAFAQVPYCIDGAFSRPPEGVGGWRGYRRLQEAMADPRHPEHYAIAKLHGDVFDPTPFWCGHVNQRLKRMWD